MVHTRTHTHTHTHTRLIAEVCLLVGSRVDRLIQPQCCVCWRALVACMYVCVCAPLCVCVCECVSKCVCVCLHVCVYVYTDLSDDEVVGVIANSPWEKGSQPVQV